MEIKSAENLLVQSFSVTYQYHVYFTRSLFDTDNFLLRNFLLSKQEMGSQIKKLLFVVDEGVWKNFPGLGQQITDYCKTLSKHYQLCCHPLIVPGGEDAKNEWTYVNQILELVNKHGIDRHSYLLAIGGGAVIDMVGFAAAIAHRGIKHIRIPTTVLSQNDSGIGVKNSINLFGKKNFIGTFAPPDAVFNDTNFLHTLHDRDWRSGIAEAIKVALIKDEAFFNRMEKTAILLANRDTETMEELIVDCARLHMEHISSNDPFEKGTSRPLDFGHWSAHKLEQMDNFGIRHGEAVAIGIALDCVYSYKAGWLSKHDLNRILQLLINVGFELYHSLLIKKDKKNNYEIVNGLEEFREHLGGKLTIMYLKSIGVGIEKYEVDTVRLIESIHYLKENYSS